MRFRRSTKLSSPGCAWCGRIALVLIKLYYFFLSEVLKGLGYAPTMVSAVQGKRGLSQNNVKAHRSKAATTTATVRCIKRRRTPLQTVPAFHPFEGSIVASRPLFEEQHCSMTTATSALCKKWKALPPQ